MDKTKILFYLKKANQTNEILKRCLYLLALNGIELDTKTREMLKDL